MDRREFIKKGSRILAGSACVYSLPLLGASKLRAASPKDLSSTYKWGMVVDLNKCPLDCNACLEACRKENNVALQGDKSRDIHLIRKVKIKRKHSSHSAEKAVPLMCNHCEHPPCVKVCPVKASYKRSDGIVLVDPHRCIGCRYCVIACPYNARYFNFKTNTEWPNKVYPKRSHGVAESCTFCAHLVDQGKKPACVEACKARALVFGNLNDPKSEVSRLLAEHPAKGIREDLGTKPKVYYLGL